MGKEEVDFIKKNKKHLIESCCESSYGVIYGYKDHIKDDVCFARLEAFLHHIPPKNDCIQYLLQWDDKNEFLDMDKLFKELKELFKHRFTIVRYKSGRKKCRIIDIRLKNSFPHKDLRFIGYYLIMNLLRQLDGEGVEKWHGISVRAKVEFPIDNWYDFIYTYYKYGMSNNHGINDDIYALRPTGRNENKGAEELFKIAIEDYLNTIKTAFGKPFNFRMRKETAEKMYSEVVKEHPNYYRRTYTYNSLRCGQTPCFTITKKFVQKKGEQNDKKK